MDMDASMLVELPLMFMCAELDGVAIVMLLDMAPASMVGVLVPVWDM
jgi:hypothetical protein